VRYYDRLVAHLRAGAIGELRAIVVYGPVNVVNHGPHWYDRLLALAGDAEVESVAGWVDPLTNEPADSRRHMDPPGGGQVRLANGVDGYITPRNVGSGFDMSFDLIGSTGRIVVSSDGADTRRWRDGRWGELEGLGPGQGSPWADAPPWPTMVADLFDAVRDRRPTRCDVDAARRASEVAFAIHHSHRAGGRSVSPAEVDRDLRVPSFPWGNE
jgi:predicted dehydrogenase